MLCNQLHCQSTLNLESTIARVLWNCWANEWSHWNKGGSLCFMLGMCYKIRYYSTSEEIPWYWYCKKYCLKIARCQPHIRSNLGFRTLLKDTSTCSSAQPRAGIWTSNLSITSQPALPAELQLPLSQYHVIQNLWQHNNYHDNDMISIYYNPNVRDKASLLCQWVE